MDKHDLNTEGPQISVNDDKAKMADETLSSEDAENILLAIGNTVAVATLDNQLKVKQTPAAPKRTPKSRQYVENRRGAV